MGDAFKDGCDHGHDDDACAICRGEPLDPGFVAWLEQAAAQPGRVMTAEEMVEWVRSL